MNHRTAPDGDDTDNKQTVPGHAHYKKIATERARTTNAHALPSFSHHIILNNKDDNNDGVRNIASIHSKRHHRKGKFLPASRWLLSSITSNKQLLVARHRWRRPSTAPGGGCIETSPRLMVPPLVVEGEKGLVFFLCSRLSFLPRFETTA